MKRAYVKNVRFKVMYSITLKFTLFYRPWTGSIKTLGFHKGNVTCILLLGEEMIRQFHKKQIDNSLSYVVMSGDKKGEVKIWWDGGSAITCTQSHLSSVKELRVFTTQVTH